MDNSPPPLPLSAPALWNPNAAGCWSLLFSPAFGAFLHARNATALGRPDEAARNYKWFYGYLIVMVINFACIYVPAIPDRAFTLLMLAILLAWYFTCGANQARFVQSTYGASYPRKSFVQPILITVACTFVYLCLATTLTYVAEFLFGIEIPEGS